MKILDQYLELQRQIFDYFGYVEGWKVIPLQDSRECFWRLCGDGPGEVRFADTKELLDDEKHNFYTNEIYMQRNLPKWVYRGGQYTMIVVDSLVDGNKFLQIFDNSKECK